MVTHVIQPDIKIQTEYCPFSLLEYPEDSKVKLTARPGWLEEAAKWLEPRIRGGDIEKINNPDNSVTYVLHCSVSTVVRELVACNMAPKEIFNQVKQQVVQDSYSCNFKAITAWRIHVPTLFNLCLTHINNNQKFTPENTIHLPEDLKPRLTFKQ